MVDLCHRRSLHSSPSLLSPSCGTNLQIGLFVTCIIHAFYNNNRLAYETVSWMLGGAKKSGGGTGDEGMTLRLVGEEMPPFPFLRLRLLFPSTVANKGCRVADPLVLLRLLQYHQLFLLLPHTNHLLAHHLRCLMVDTSIVLRLLQHYQFFLLLPHTNHLLAHHPRACVADPLVLLLLLQLRQSCLFLLLPRTNHLRALHPLILHHSIQLALQMTTTWMTTTCITLRSGIIYFFNFDDKGRNFNRVLFLYKAF